MPGFISLTGVVISDKEMKQFHYNDIGSRIEGLKEGKEALKDNDDEVRETRTVFWKTYPGITKNEVMQNVSVTCLNKSHITLGVHTFFYRQLGCLAFSLRFWPEIKQLLSNCPASDLTFSSKTAYFH